MRHYWNKAAKYSARARGVTLIELLVVIMVMLLITAIAIPVVAPAIKNRQIRESARMVDVFLNGAKNRAIQTGRPVGVVFEFDVPGGSTAIQAGNLNVGGAAAYTMPGGSTVLSYAEVPPSYTGDFSNSTINVRETGATVISTTSLSIFNNQDIGWYQLVRPGDLIRFNGHATLYRIFLGEPYFDVDGNGIFTPGVDAFIDTNKSGLYEGPPPGVVVNGYLTTLTAVTPLIAATNWGMWTYTFADPVLALQYMSWPVGGVYLPPTNTSFGQNGAATFEIVRQPVPQAAGKLELPDTAAVDFGTTIGTSATDAVAIPASGYDTVPPPNPLPTPPPSIGASFRPYPISPFSATTTAPPPYTSRMMITFAPTGLVDMVYSWDEPTFTWNPATVGWQGRQAQGPIYFLVGRRDLVGGDPTLLPQVLNGQAPSQPCFNFQDPASLWIVINPQTGAIMSTQNAAVNLTLAPPLGSNQQQALTFWWQQVYQARSLARQSLAVGGR